MEEGEKKKNKEILTYPVLFRTEAPESQNPIAKAVLKLNVWPILVGWREAGESGVSGHP